MPIARNALEVVYLGIDQIKPYEKKLRKHGKLHDEMLDHSVQDVGFINPLLVTKDKVIIAGHARFEAAKRAAMETVPCIILPNLSPAQEAKLRIRDNAIAEQGKWSVEVLAQEIAFITTIDLDLKPIELGFTTPQFDAFLGKQPENDDMDEIEPAYDEPAVSRTGDLWYFAGGRYRLLCGDARNHDDYLRVLRGELADTVFADMPYNVPVKGHVSGHGKTIHREFAMASGEMSLAEYRQFMADVFERQIAASKPGSVHFQCNDWRSIAPMIAVGLESYEKLLNVCVWAKTGAPGMGSLYRSQHELVAVFKQGGAKHRNNVELGKNGRNRSNLWSYPGVAGFSQTRAQDLKDHPTCKPVAMVSDAIQDVTDRDGLVLDPFMGSGTTLLAANACGRRCIGLEVDAHYVDVAIRRIGARAGLTAIHEDGRRFDQVRADREGGADHA